MKIFIPSLICLILFVAILSCDDRDDNLTGPNIRIQNLSNENYLLVEFPSDTIRYENIAAEGFSEYQEFDEAFEQMAFTVTTDSADFDFVPPELPFEPLPIGLYTYQVDINEDKELILNFKID